MAAPHGLELNMPIPRCAATLLEQTLDHWHRVARTHDPRGDLWLFAYGSLIWKTEFTVTERLPATVFGHHRALQMWSRVNRGTPERPGLVFALLPGGSCQGMALRVPGRQVADVLPQLWKREMPNPVYDPRWLRARTPVGAVTALAFTLSRRSPNFTGPLSAAQYRDIFHHASGRYGRTIDYALQTHHHLRALGIRDRALSALLQEAWLRDAGQHSIDGPNGQNPSAGDIVPA